MDLLKNTIQKNGTQAYKFADITVRVYVDLDELDSLMENGYQDEEGESVKPDSEEAAFDKLAREKILSLFPTDEPCKFYDANLS